MKRKFRLVAIAGVAALTVGLLAACSGGTSSSGSLKGQTIHVLSFGKMRPSFLADFKKKTGITVKFEAVDSSVYPQVLQTRVSSKADIDVLNNRGGAEFNKYAAAHTYLDLTGQSFLKNVTSGGLEPGVVGGKTYGFSASSYAIGVFYNQDLFKKLGIGIPTNWDELVSDAAKIKSSGVAPFVGSAGDGWTNQYWYHNAIATYAHQHPTFMADLKTGKSTWQKNSLFTEQVSRFADLVKAGDFIDGASSLHYADAASAFSNGKAAMWVMGDWSLADIKPVGFTPGAFALPINNNGQPAAVASSLSDNMWAVTSWSKKKAAALAFLNYMTEAGPAKTYSEEQDRASAIKGVTATISPYQKDWDGLLAAAVPYPDNIGPSVNGTGPNLLGDVLAGNATSTVTVTAFQALQKTDNGTGY